MSKWIRRGTVPALCLVALGAAGCGDYVREGRGPVTGRRGRCCRPRRASSPDELGGTLNSDVITYVKKTIDGVEVRVPTIFNDVGLGDAPRRPEGSRPSPSRRR